MIARAKLVAASSMVVFKTSKATLTPDWTISGSCDWAKVRPIDNFCYDLQQPRSISTRAWSRYHERLENIDDKSHRRKSCDYSI